MCLYRLREGLPKWTKGYKVVRVARTRGRRYMYGEFQSMGTRRPKRRWLDEKYYRIIPGKSAIYIGASSIAYPTGWHVYKYPPSRVSRDPEPEVETVEVKCRKPLAHGFESGMEVGVFKEILFL